jgi:multidrug efflux pump subunit AcrB
MFDLRDICIHKESNFRAEGFDDMLCLIQRTQDRRCARENAKSLIKMGPRRPLRDQRFALIALSFVTFSMAVIAQTSPSASLLTEQEAVELARSANRPTKSTSIGIDRAIQSVRQAKTAYFPQTNLYMMSGHPLAGFSFTIPAGALGTYPSTGPLPSQNEHVSENPQFSGMIIGTVEQPLTQLYTTHLAVASARVDQKIATEQLRSQYQSLTGQVRQTYHQICVLEVQIDSDTEQIRALEEALRNTENNAAQGTALRSDVLQAQAALAQARYNLASDQNARINSREQLNYQLARDVDTDFAVEVLPPVEQDEMSLADARATALKQRPELREARLQEQKADLAIRQEKMSDLQNIYVPSPSGSQKIPLRAVSEMQPMLTTQLIRRQEHFRTVGVHTWPLHGVLPFEIMKQALPQLTALEKTLPPGYKMVIGGSLAKQQQGFQNLAVVMLISIVGIYIALLSQFKNAIKPLLVFAAVPYGIVGAIICLTVTGTPFGFMAFLGITSLIGVIVSHIIVLFDFIEERREAGEPIERALVDAGIERLRPVLITAGATIFALFPLAIHGGPLWQPLCYAQIGGLAVATFITLLLVPVLYSIAVLDLKIVRWEQPHEQLLAFQD